MRTRSRLARGAWIETLLQYYKTFSFRSRLARGAWIETSEKYSYSQLSGCRASQGARGLKRILSMPTSRRWRSRLARGAWIETLSYTSTNLYAGVAPRKGRVD